MAKGKRRQRQERAMAEVPVVQVADCPHCAGRLNILLMDGQVMAVTSPLGEQQFIDPLDRVPAEERQFLFDPHSGVALLSPEGLEVVHMAEPKERIKMEGAGD